MEDWKRVLDRIVADPRYKTGILYGKPRQGHQEGTVLNHIQQLEHNLKALKRFLTNDEYWKLLILIHVHDTFKFQAKRGSPIEDPQSHASLARAFLKEFTDNWDLLQMIQWHDESFVMHRQMETKGGKYNKERFYHRIIEGIMDLNLFLFFTIIDGFTPSKMHDVHRIRWFVGECRDSNRQPYLDRVYQALQELHI